MSMTKPVNMEEFERLTGITLFKNEFDNDEEMFFALVWVGGKDEEGFYERVTEGPAEGERVYL